MPKKENSTKKLRLRLEDFYQYIQPRIKCAAVFLILSLIVVVVTHLVAAKHRVGLKFVIASVTARVLLLWEQGVRVIAVIARLLNRMPRTTPWYLLCSEPHHNIYHATYNAESCINHIHIYKAITFILPRTILHHVLCHKPNRICSMPHTTMNHT